MPAEAKICGLTRPEDAAVAVAAGAAYVGVVYAGGPRRVSDDTARAIVLAAAGRPVLGVFGDQSGDEILRVRDATGIRGAQLHGAGYGAADAARLRAEGMVVWRVVRLRAGEGLNHLPAYADAADAVLIEPRVPGADGGAGVALDLELARAARERLDGHRVVLAGGLTPETVAAALALVAAEVADVSSGVETHPGIKDPERIRRFVEAVVGQHAIR